MSTELLGQYKEKVERNERDIRDMNKTVGDGFLALHGRISETKKEMAEKLDSQFKWIVRLGFSMLATVIIGAAIVIWTLIKFHAGIVDV